MIVFNALIAAGFYGAISNLNLVEMLIDPRQLGELDDLPLLINSIVTLLFLRASFSTNFTYLYSAAFFAAGFSKPEIQDPLFAFTIVVVSLYEMYTDSPDFFEPMSTNPALAVNTSVKTTPKNKSGMRSRSPTGAKKCTEVKKRTEIKSVKSDGHAAQSPSPHGSDFPDDSLERESVKAKRQISQHLSSTPRRYADQDTYSKRNSGKTNHLITPSPSFTPSESVAQERFSKEPCAAGMSTFSKSPMRKTGSPAVLENAREKAARDQQERMIQRLNKLRA